MSFTTFSELTNDELTRVFLAVEIGAGHHEVNNRWGNPLCPNWLSQLKSLATALTPIVRQFRQQGYYGNPRFHASIAWALCDKDSPNPSAEAEDTISATGSLRSGSQQMLEFNAAPTIPHFPKGLISTLNERYSSTLASTKVGLFDAEFITVKIGKDTFTWNLSGWPT